MRTTVLRDAASGDVVCERCELATRPWTRMRGLLGRDGLEPGGGMLFSRTGAVHTYRMRFAIDVVFLDRDLTVLSVHPDVGPGRRAKQRGARWTLELPAGAAARVGLTPGMRLVLGGQASA